MCVVTCVYVLVTFVDDFLPYEVKYVQVVRYYYDYIIY